MITSPKPFPFEIKANVQLYRGAADLRDMAAAHHRMRKLLELYRIHDVTTRIVRRCN